MAIKNGGEFTKLRPETESWNSGDHELWNHEMRVSPVIRENIYGNQLNFYKSMKNLTMKFGSYIRSECNGGWQNDKGIRPVYYTSIFSHCNNLID